MKTKSTALFTVGLISAVSALASPQPDQARELHDPNEGCTLSDAVSCDGITSTSSHAEPALDPKSEMAKVIELFADIDVLLSANQGESL